MSVQCGFGDGLGGVQLFDQKWAFVLRDGTRTTVSDDTPPIAIVDDEDEGGEDGEEGEEGEENDSEGDDGNENEEDGDGVFCFVTNAGSVVTCQWEVCGTEPAALE